MVAPHSLSGTDLSAPPLDMERLRLVADSKEEEEELLALFFDGAEEKIQAMERAAAAASWGDWQQAAHYLKGSGANLGMQVFVEKCRQAELNEPSSAENALILVSDIKAELVRAKAYVGTL